MNKYICYSIILAAILTFSIAHAEPPIGYVLLEPAVIGTTGEVTANTYAQNIYVTLLKVTVALAVLMLVISGLQYVLSAVPGAKGQALHQIQAALLGLVIALCSWLILATINPDLLKLDFTLSKYVQ